MSDVVKQVLGNPTEELKPVTPTRFWHTDIKPRKSGLEVTGQIVQNRYRIL